jgi:hypothetical protein
LSFEWALRELERLKDRLPTSVILHLKDGSVYTHPPTSQWDFVSDAFAALDARSGPLFQAFEQVVSGDNCARLWELFSAMTTFVPIPTRRKEN